VILLSPNNMYVICIKGLKLINDAKFHIMISTAKYIIAIKNKTYVIRKNPVVVSLYLRIFLFQPNFKKNNEIIFNE